MKLLLILFMSLGLLADDHDDMYEEVYADYLYCNDDDNLSAERRDEAFEDFIEAWNEHASSFDNSVALSAVYPFYTNDDMRSGADFMFVRHAPSRQALGAFLLQMYNLVSEDDDMPKAPFECDNASEAYQLVGPSSDGDLGSSGMVEYYPCNYTEDADPDAMFEAQAKFALEHYANGARGGYRYIFPGSGSDRVNSPDFYVSVGSPDIEARGAGIDLYWSESRGSEAELERRKHAECQKSSVWYWERLKEG